MRCRVCSDPAVLEVPRHNAAFCQDHFVRHCHQQVERAVHKHKMLEGDDRILVAVSGGKDSLMLWDTLCELGYVAGGLYIDLGIGEYSKQSRVRCESFAAASNRDLAIVDLAGAYGFDVPTGARAARRAPCGTCGLSKRYVMNDIARSLGYDVLATGHNLDDEAAVLFGNLLRWNTEALRRQRPVLAESSGFARKVKPLIRLGERETAAYCVLRGIDYIVEECPLVGGNIGLGYKSALNDIEARSPGTKHQLYFGFLERGLERFALPSDNAELDVHPCAQCAAPTTAHVCAFCRLAHLARSPH